MKKIKITDKKYVIGTLDRCPKLELEITFERKKNAFKSLAFGNAASNLVVTGIKGHSRGKFMNKNT